MRYFRSLAALAMTTGLLITAPLTLRAAQPEALPQKVFDVQVKGGVVEVTFALALNEVSTYPLTITAVSGSVEEVLWQGTLSEGIYRLSAPLTKISSGPLKVVLRTKLTNRDERGAQTFLRYVTWEGSVN
jgi:hypothetical protein